MPIVKAKFSHNFPWISDNFKRPPNKRTNFYARNPRKGCACMHDNFCYGIFVIRVSLCNNLNSKKNKFCYHRMIYSNLKSSKTWDRNNSKTFTTRERKDTNSSIAKILSIVATFSNPDFPSGLKMTLPTQQVFANTRKTSQLRLNSW